jgi:hypothetical protein
MKMPKICRSSPFLFISGFPFSDDKLAEFDQFLTVDFLTKPFGFRALKNRVKILLSVSGQCFRYLFKRGVEEADSEHFSFYPFVALVLDEDLKIHFANYQLRRLVGDPSGDLLYSMDWSGFIPENKRDDVRKLHRYVFQKIEAIENEYLECDYQIITASGPACLLKWGYTIFQAAPGDHKLILGIGTIEDELSPLLRKNRAYWEREIIIQRAAIQHVKRKTAKDRQASESISACKINGG